MRVLVIDKNAEVIVDRVLGFAMKPENYYVVEDYSGFSFQKPPGDDPRHVAHLPVGFRAVFSITRSPVKKLYRHLSISVDGTKLPNQFAAYTIAEMFGFTGWDGKTDILPAGWSLDVNKKDRCVILAQLLETE